MKSSSTKPLIVFDTIVSEFHANRVFDSAYAAEFPGALALAKLSELVRQKGFEMVTSDVYAAARVPREGAICISDNVTPFVSSNLRDGKLIGAIIVNYESPNVDMRFYHNLESRSRLFKHAFIFRGAQTRVAKDTTFHVAYFPQARRQVISGPAWQDRGWLVMISSNKQAARVRKIFNASDPLVVKLKNLYRALLHNWILLVDPLLYVQDLYRVRVEAAYYFSQRSGFRLFGRNWDLPINGFPGRYKNALQHCLGGPVEDKLAIMRGYRFALCFENCVFPGYVTEKIFDCFFTGCVPIYYGAPDIGDFVPSECFIDYRKFNSFPELDRYLREMPPAEHARFLEAAASFLASSAFDPFYIDSVVDTWFNCLVNSLDQ